MEKVSLSPVQLTIAVSAVLFVVGYVYGILYFKGVAQKEEIVFWKGQHETLKVAFDTQTKIMQSLFGKLHELGYQVTLTYGEDKTEVDLTDLYVNRKEEGNGQVECNIEQ